MKVVIGLPVNNKAKYRVYDTEQHKVIWQTNVSDCSVSKLDYPKFDEQGIVVGDKKLVVVSYITNLKSFLICDTTKDLPYLVDSATLREYIENLKLQVVNVYISKEGKLKSKVKLHTEEVDLSKSNSLVDKKTLNAINESVHTLMQKFSLLSLSSQEQSKKFVNYLNNNTKYEKKDLLIAVYLNASQIGIDFGIGFNETVSIENRRAILKDIKALDAYSLEKGLEKYASSLMFLCEPENTKSCIFLNLSKGNTSTKNISSVMLLEVYRHSGGAHFSNCANLRRINTDGLDCAYQDEYGYGSTSTSSCNFYNCKSLAFDYIPKDISLLRGQAFLNTHYKSNVLYVGDNVEIYRGDVRSLVFDYDKLDTVYLGKSINGLCFKQSNVLLKDKLPNIDIVVGSAAFSSLPLLKYIIDNNGTIFVPYNGKLSERIEQAKEFYGLKTREVGTEAIDRVNSKMLDWCNKYGFKFNPLRLADKSKSVPSVENNVHFVVRKKSYPGFAKGDTLNVCYTELPDKEIEAYLNKQKKYHRDYLQSLLNHIEKYCYLSYTCQRSLYIIIHEYLSSIYGDKLYALYDKYKELVAVEREVSGDFEKLRKASMDVFILKMFFVLLVLLASKENDIYNVCPINIKHFIYNSETFYKALEIYGGYIPNNIRNYLACLLRATKLFKVFDKSADNYYIKNALAISKEQIDLENNLSKLKGNKKELDSYLKTVADKYYNVEISTYATRYLTNSPCNIETLTKNGVLNNNLYATAYKYYNALNNFDDYSVDINLRHSNLSMNLLIELENRLKKSKIRFKTLTDKDVCSLNRYTVIDNTPEKIAQALTILGYCCMDDTSKGAYRATADYFGTDKVPYECYSLCPNRLELINIQPPDMYDKSLFKTCGDFIWLYYARNTESKYRKAATLMLKSMNLELYNVLIKEHSELTIIENKTAPKDNINFNVYYNTGGQFLCDCMVLPYRYTQKRYRQYQEIYGYSSVTDIDSVFFDTDFENIAELSKIEDMNVVK